MSLFQKEIPMLSSSLRFTARAPHLLHALRSHTHAASLSAMETEEIKQYFSRLSQYAVVGASSDRNKFGNKVLRCYQANGYSVVPINKKEKEIEGLACKALLSEEVDRAASTGVSVVTSPAVTKAVLQEALAQGFRHFFFQPGTVDEEVEALMKSEKAKLGDDVHFIQNCVLIQLGCEH